MENNNQINLAEQPSNDFSNLQTSPAPTSYFTTTTWVVIFIVAALLIFYFITYYSSGLQNVTYMTTKLQQLLNSFMGIIKRTVSGTPEVYEEDTKNEISFNDTETSLSSQSVQNEQEQPQISQSTQQNALNNTFKDPYSQTSSPPEYEASSAQSTINSGGKGAWCYVGQDRGVRSCAQVGENQECMSGDIFPTSELCINPNLRQ